MKKILYGSTALVAASLISVAAQAADPIKLQLGGFSRWYVGAAGNKNAYLRSTAQQNPAIDVQGNNEVHFIGSTKLDNGISVGVKVEMEADQGVGSGTNGESIDESQLWVSGAFGKVILGGEDNGLYLLGVSSTQATADLKGQDSVLGEGRWIVKPASVTIAGGTTTMSTVVDTGADANKITYVTPTFSGFTAGATYMPGQNTQYGRDNYTYSNGAAIAGEAWGAGVQYKNTFGGVGFAASAGYMSTDLQALKDNMREWNVGTDISYAGFNVGGSYRGVRTNFSAADRALTGASAISSPNGRLWEVGAGYTTGPFAVSLQYVDSRADGLINGTAGSVGKDKARIWSLNGAYNMGPGIKLVGAVANVKWRDEAGAGTNSIGENKGWAGITGFEVTF